MSGCSHESQKRISVHFWFVSKSAFSPEGSIKKDPVGRPPPFERLTGPGQERVLYGRYKADTTLVRAIILYVLSVAVPHTTPRDDYRLSFRPFCK